MHPEMREPMRLLSTLILWIASSGCITCQLQTCLPTASECEFSLTVKESLAMQKDDNLLVPRKGQIYSYNDYSLPIPDGFIQADGWNYNTRIVMVVNDTMPGPPIHVYENQIVTVHVTNHFESETLTIHWHGIHQNDSPYMDGVPFVSQCPILPGQTFDYRFKAYPVGTHWYHSHSGAQRTNGVHGAFIVHPRSAESTNNELTLVLADWVHDYDSMTGHLKMNYGLFNNLTKYKPTQSLDGANFSVLQFQSGLINGKGRYWSSNTTHNEAPLHRFAVEKNLKYRFRVIGAGALYPFRVSVDEHPLTVIATDGYSIVPVTVESFVINPGERVDFEISTNQTAKNYWIRAVSLEHQTARPHIAEAILSYPGADNSTDYDKVVNTSRKRCTPSDPCLVLNCPFVLYPDEAATRCLHYSDLSSSASPPVEAPGADGDYKDIFLNFAFPGIHSMPGSVNGRKFLAPSSMAFVDRSGFIPCSPDECGHNQSCACTYTVDLQYGKTYQLVFLNLGNGKGWGHPIHLHGHSFYIVKAGFGIYNAAGQIVGDTPDIVCADYFCNEASWNSSVGRPDARLKGVVQKDTIIVPTGGYVAVRVKADNPGVWLMHCHIDMHHMDGMAALVDSGADRRPPLPLDFPRCGSYKYQGVNKASRSDAAFLKKLVPLLAAFATTIAAISTLK